MYTSKVAKAVRQALNERFFYEHDFSDKDEQCE